MKPIAYRRQIEISPGGKHLNIKTDSGDHFIGFERKSISDWFREIPPSDFRSTQKEYLKLLLDGESMRSPMGLGPYKTYVCFRPGEDYKTESYDLVIVKTQEISVVSTYRHTWFVPHTKDQLKLRDSDQDDVICLDSIESESTKDHIWRHRDANRRLAESRDR